jgi:hypothetical protein
MGAKTNKVSKDFYQDIDFTLCGNHHQDLQGIYQFAGRF